MTTVRDLLLVRNSYVFSHPVRSLRSLELVGLAVLPLSLSGLGYGPFFVRTVDQTIDTGPCLAGKCGLLLGNPANPRQCCYAKEEAGV